MALRTLSEAEDAARKAGLAPPDSAAILQIYQEAAAKNMHITLVWLEITNQKTDWSTHRIY